MKVKLWIKLREGTETSYTDEYDNPIPTMKWKTKVYTKIIDNTELRINLERLNDADYDFSSEVLFVTDVKGKMLLNLSDQKYVDYSEYMDEENKQKFFDRMRARRKHREDLIEDRITRIENIPEYDYSLNEQGDSFDVYYDDVYLTTVQDCDDEDEAISVVRDTLISWSAVPSKMVCKKCGSKEFNEDDAGVQFCIKCNTQYGEV